jgi:hypothetical protein
MIAALKRAYAAFRGFDDETGSAPMMDGPLRPNALLDGAPVALSLTDVDNLTQHRGALLCSSGSQVLLLTPHNGSLSASDARAFEQAVTFVAAGPSDSLAIGLDRQGVLILEGRHAGKAIAEAGGQPLCSPTAALFIDADRLIVATEPKAGQPRIGSATSWNVGRREVFGSSICPRLARPRSGLARTSLFQPVSSTRPTADCTCRRLGCIGSSLSRLRGRAHRNLSFLTSQPIRDVSRVRRTAGIGLPSSRLAIS